MQAESKRLEKLAEEERHRKMREKSARIRKDSRQEYEVRWKDLPLYSGEPSLTFNDVPWPVFMKRGSSPSVADLNYEAIADFLWSFTGGHKLTDAEVRHSESEERTKSQKDILRETFLRFHPDKFEGRLMKFVKEEERSQVKEGLVQVVRVLNELMISEPKAG
jgi:hypothetical protein